MVQSECSRVHLNNQISVSQVLARLAHKEINHAAEVQDPQPEEEAEDCFKKEQGDEGDPFGMQFDLESFDSDTCLFTSFSRTKMRWTTWLLNLQSLGKHAALTSKAGGSARGFGPPMTEPNVSSANLM
jgi:hypothetical protein